jgi:MFS family permease
MEQNGGSKGRPTDQRATARIDREEIKMEKNLKRNINIVYGLAFFHMFMLIIPVLVPFFQSKGLSLAEIFYLQAIYAAAIVILEAPSGYFADVMGRRLALIIGALAHGAGYLWLNFAEGFWGLVAFELMLGVSVSMLSGADLALLYDSEKALAAEDVEHTQSLAQLGFTKSVAEGLGALLGGLLSMWSFDLMILVQSVMAWGCLWFALMVIEPPVENNADTPRRAISLGEIWAHVARGDPILRLVFIALPIYNIATINVVWLIQPYWENMGLPLAVFGVLWFAQSLTVAVASKCGYVLERTRGPVHALIIIGILPVIGIFGMAWIGGWGGIVLCFVLFFCRGLYHVILVNAMNRRIPSEFRATVNSLNSLVFRFAFIITGPFVGYIADLYGISIALNVIGLWSIMAFVLIMLPLIRAVRTMQNNKLAVAAKTA